jgi:hypothetical protein
VKDVEVSERVLEMEHLRIRKSPEIGPASSFGFTGLEKRNVASQNRVPQGGCAENFRRRLGRGFAKEILRFEETEAEVEGAVKPVEVHEENVQKEPGQVPVRERPGGVEGADLGHNPGQIILREEPLGHELGERAVDIDRLVRDRFPDGRRCDGRRGRSRCGQEDENECGGKESDRKLLSPALPGSSSRVARKTEPLSRVQRSSPQEWGQLNRIFPALSKRVS